MRRYSAFGCFSVIATVGLSACGGGESPTEPVGGNDTPVATTVVLSATSVSLSDVGATEQLTATVQDQTGATMTDVSVAWSTSASAVATVSSSGLVTAQGQGTATVTATAGSATGSAQVTVTVPVTAVTIAPATDTVSPGGTTQLSATLKDSAGNTLSGRTINWSSTDPSVATVSTSGLVSAVADGIVTVIAESEGVADSATVTVAPLPVAMVAVTPGADSVVAGSTVAFDAETRDTDGTEVTDRTVTWTSSDESVATVSQDGVVSGVSGGVVSIVAESEGAADTASVTVVDDISGIYVGTLSGSVSGVQLTGTFTLNFSQDLTSLSGSYTLSGTLYDGFTSVPIEGSGPISGAIEGGVDPAVEMTVTVPGCPAYSADFTGGFNSATQVLTLSGPIDVLNQDCSIFLRYPSVIVLTR